MEATRSLPNGSMKLLSSLLTITLLFFFSLFFGLNLVIVLGAIVVVVVGPIGSREVGGDVVASNAIAEAVLY